MGKRKCSRCKGKGRIPNGRIKGTWYDKTKVCPECSGRGSK